MIKVLEQINRTDGDTSFLLSHLRIGLCIAPMTFGQLRAIFENYLNENPELWHEDVAFLLWNALDGVCKEEEN